MMRRRLWDGTPIWDDAPDPTLWEGLGGTVSPDLAGRVRFTTPGLQPSDSLGGVTTAPESTAILPLPPDAPSPHAPPPGSPYVPPVIEREPQPGYNYEALRDYLFGQGRALQTREDLERLLKARPDISQGVVIEGAGDIIRLPTGERIDVIANFGDPARAMAAWTGLDDGSEPAASEAPSPAPLPPASTWTPMMGPASYVEPGGAGVFTGPLQQVGDDPFSQLVTGTLAQAVQSGLQTPFSQELEKALTGLIARGGYPEADTLRLRWESEREALDRLRRAQLEQARAELAARGLLSEPGVPQGPEFQTLRRIEEALGAEYATRLRDLIADERQRAQERLLSGLALGTQYATTQARNWLDALRAATERQQALSEIALGVLDRNMAWNRFLAEFGLQRDQVLQLIREGRAAALLPVVQLFAQLAAQAAAGYV